VEPGWKPGSAVAADLERDILVDFSPEVFQTKTPKQNQEQAPAIAKEPVSGVRLLASMTEEERTQFAVEVAHSVPFPAVLKRIAFGVYRIWFRLTSR